MTSRDTGLEALCAVPPYDPLGLAERLTKVAGQGDDAGRRRSGITAIVAMAAGL